MTHTIGWLCLYVKLCSNEIKIMSLFGSAYICEQAFSLMNMNKNKLHSVLTDDNLQAILCISTTKFNPDITGLSVVKKYNASHKY